MTFWKLTFRQFTKYINKKIKRIYCLHSTILKTIGLEIPENLTEKVKNCCCEIAEKIYFFDSENSDISSEKIGNYSVNYVGFSEKNAQLNKECRAIICRYLGNSGLLYRGVD